MVLLIQVIACEYVYVGIYVFLYCIAVMTHKYYICIIYVFVQIRTLVQEE